MVRTQVYFTEAQHRALHRAAEREGLSMTELLRRLVDRHLLARRGPLDFDKEAVLALVGLGESGETRTSAEHDAALDEALRAPAVR
jgi:hypothetical protein